MLWLSDYTSIYYNVSLILSIVGAQFIAPVFNIIEQNQHGCDKPRPSIYIIHIWTKLMKGLLIFLLCRPIIQFVDFLCPSTHIPKSIASLRCSKINAFWFHLANVTVPRILYFSGHFDFSLINNFCCFFSLFRDSFTWSGVCKCSGIVPPSSCIVCRTFSPTS
jgi:hypothetical protein